MSVQTAYNLFIEAHAMYTGRTEQEVASETSSYAFEAQVRGLHRRYLQGEFSMGRFTELMGVAHLELWEILDALHLSLHPTP